MLDEHDAGLLIIDVQGKLARMMHDSEAMIANIRRMIRACQILSVPIVWIEQYPQGLGETVEELSELLVDLTPHIKSTFSVCDCESTLQPLEASGRKQWMVCGIEAHICVYQTVVGMLQRAYQVEVISDAVSSRAASNHQLALQKMHEHGAGISSVEMAVYELLKDSARPEFKAMLPLMK